MKKYLVVLSTMILVLLVASSSHAILFTETVNVGALYGADSGGHIWQGDDVAVWYYWDFTTPSDFTVPYDIVNSATVDVRVGWVDTFGNDYFFAASPVDFVITELDQNTATYTLPVGSLLVNWVQGGVLECSLLIDEQLIDGDIWNGDIILGNSTFTLDYTNGTAPVPEPTTLLLLGSGLVGLAGFRRKVKK